MFTPVDTFLDYMTECIMKLSKKSNLDWGCKY